jgi:hypothetical protein
MYSRSSQKVSNYIEQKNEADVSIDSFERNEAAVMSNENINGINYELHGSNMRVN